MVFKMGNHDLIAWLDEDFSKAMGNQINPFGTSSNKNDLFFTFSMDKFGDSAPGTFIEIGSPFSVLMGAAMDIGIFFSEKFIHGFHHCSRFLSGCCIVEPNHRSG